MDTPNSIPQIDNYFRSILQATFHNLPDLVINVAREYNVTDSEALILIRDKLTQQINLVANQPQAIYNATDKKIKSLQSEIAFIKKLYVKNNDELMSKNNNLNRQYLTCVGNKTTIEQSLESAKQELAQTRRLGLTNSRNNDLNNAKLQKQIDDLNREKDALQGHIQTLINDRNDVLSKLGRSALKGFEVQNALEQARSRNESEANEYRQSLANMNDRYNENLFNLVKIINPNAEREDIQKMWSNLVTHLESVAVLRETEQNLRSDLETLNLANAGKENAAINKLRAELLVKQRDVQQLQQDLSEARNSNEHLLANYTIDCEDLKKQLQSSEENVQRLENQKKELSTNYQVLNVELSELKQTTGHNANASDTNANEITRLKDELQKTFDKYKDATAKLGAAQEELQKERNTLKLFEKQVNQIPSTAILSNLKHQAELFKRKEINTDAFVSDILQIINDPNYKRSIDYGGDVNTQSSIEQEHSQSAQSTATSSTSTEIHRRKRVRRDTKPSSSNTSNIADTRNRSRSRSPSRSRSSRRSSRTSNGSSDSDDDSNKSRTRESLKREQTLDSSIGKKRVCLTQNIPEVSPTQESSFLNNTISIASNNDAIQNATESQLEDSTDYGINVTL